MVHDAATPPTVLVSVIQYYTREGSPPNLEHTVQRNEHVRAATVLHGAMGSSLNGDG